MPKITPRLRTKIIYISIFTAILTSVWHSIRSYEEKQEANNLIKKSKTATQRAAVLELANRNSAETDWAKALAHDKQLRISPVHSIELQSLWVKQKPILFVGKIEDISEISPNTASVTVRYEGLSNKYSFSSTTIKLKLKCSIEMMEGTIRNISNPSYLSILADLAVIANVDSIEQVSTTNTESNYEEKILRGHGVCLEVLHLPDGIYL